ncbi:MAG: iron dicitrate transport regulator FecR [Burkholderiales bacterium]|nr:iron dicitrate transport regulator FecR [Burkholderiales bacterium]
MKSCKLHPVPDLLRRSMLGAAGGAALLGMSDQVRAAQLGEVMGELYVNGFRAPPGTVIKPGDRVLTGPDTSQTFAVGQDAFRMRPLTSLQIEGGAFVAGLRVLTGGLLGVFGRGGTRTIRTSTVTAGIRGTGVYVEASSIMSYFCTCYGEVDLECVTYGSKQRVKTDNHKANFIYGKIDSGRSIVSAPVVNHSNEELMALEKMVGRRSPLG